MVVVVVVVIVILGGKKMERDARVVVVEYHAFSYDPLNKRDVITSLVVARSIN